MKDGNSTVTPTTAYLRGMRIEKQIPLGQLAAVLGVNYSTLYRWETGRCKPQALVLRAWENILKKMRAQKNPWAAPRSAP